MRRMALVIAAWLFTAGANTATAHAIVTGSSLAQRPVKLNTATQVALSFNSGIEVGLSRVMLVRKGDVLSPLEIRAGRKPGELIVKVPPLDAGEYALKYRIFAADGHLTEDVLRFRVAQ